MFSFTGFTRRTRKKNDRSQVNERFNARISSNKRASQFISALKNRITEKRKNKMARKIQTQFQTFQTRKKFLSDLATRKNTAATKLQRKFRTFNATRPLVSRPIIEDVCSICLDTMDWSSNGSVKQLDCGHLFHTKCIDNYKQTTNHFACPLCKTLSVDDKLKDIYLKAKKRYGGVKLYIISKWINQYEKIIKETKEDITKSESLYKRSMELFIQLKSKYTNNPSSPSSYLLKRLNNTILDINEYIQDINEYRDEYCKHVNNYLIQIYKDNLLPESNIIGPYGNVIIERLELPHIEELPLMEAIPPIIKTPPSGVEMPPSGVEMPPSRVEMSPSGVEMPPSGVEMPPSRVEMSPSGVDA
jgi:hypothetical protein